MGFFDFLGSLVKPKKIYSFKCPYCENQLSSSAEICSECGLRVPRVIKIKCEKCGSLNTLDSSRCGKCGSPLASKTPSFGYGCWVCGYESAKFFFVCPACGTRLV